MGTMRLEFADCSDLQSLLKGNKEAHYGKYNLMSLDVSPAHNGNQITPYVSWLILVLYFTDLHLRGKHSQ